MAKIEPTRSLTESEFKIVFEALSQYVEEDWDVDDEQVIANLNNAYEVMRSANLRTTDPE